MSPLVRGMPLPGWRPNRLNVRYEPALRLAEIVLRSCSVEHGAGAVRVNGFLINLNAVFEDFVTGALREALAPVGGRVKTQDPWHLDEAGSISMKPDLVWYPQSGPGAHPGIVVDAKYKAERASGFPNSDLYQMLAYCTVLGLPEGHLVYAQGNEVATRHTFRGSGVIVIQHTLDLSASPADLLAQIERLSIRIRTGVVRLTA